MVYTLFKAIIGTIDTVGAYKSAAIRDSGTSSLERTESEEHSAYETL